MIYDTTYVDVLLPLPLPGSFTYSVSDNFINDLSVGGRVVVQFGKSKVYTALVKKIHNQKPKNYNAKPIIEVLDSNAIVSESQFILWEWISNYYMCTQGEVMQAALPSAFKLSSESRILLNPGFTGILSDLSEREIAVLYALEHKKELTLEDISSITGLKKVFPLIKTMIEKCIIVLVEEIQQKFVLQTELLISLAPYLKEEGKLKEVFESVEKRAPRQTDILMTLIHFNQQSGETKIKKSKLLKDSGAASAQLNSLIKKGILIEEEVELSRLGPNVLPDLADSIVFSEFQSLAFSQIRDSFHEKEVVLLHGVTASGKTEIYTRLINDVLKQGKQVLYLLPEIALTAQIINRLKKYFGNRVGVYHSRNNEQERAEFWKHLKSSNPDDPDQLSVVLGARSALFLPFSNLGLIIVDEEHDSSFKQQDPAPRYHARDAAVVMAKLFGAKVLLGSATPCIETFFNAQSGKYGLVSLTERYGGVQLPEVLIVDILDESRKRTMKSHFSSFLIMKIEEALQKKEQVILFQNRRGFSLRLECETCHWIPGCKNCDVTMTYHKQLNELRCHYCGFTTTVPVRCPQCSGTVLKMKGFGTDKIEEEIPLFLPQAKVARMDFDTMRSKHSHQRIISDFEEGRIDILVGTQMVTKGLDFGNVSLVGIMNADNMLSFPDFRAFERSYQLMSQVSGRAGRKQKRGTVVIQTYNPYHAIIQQVINHDFLGMFNAQLYDRKNFNYPPYFRLIQLTLKHKNSELLNNASSRMALLLRKQLKHRVLGPEFPIVARINEYYIKQIMVKIERNSDLTKNKTLISTIIDDFKKLQDFRSIRVIIDVDPF